MIRMSFSRFLLGGGNFPNWLHTENLILSSTHSANLPPLETFSAHLSTPGMVVKQPPHNPHNRRAVKGLDDPWFTSTRSRWVQTPPQNSIYLSIYQSIDLSIKRSICQSIYIYLSIYLYVYINLSMSIYHSIYLSFSRSINLSVNQSINLSIDLSIFLSIYQTTYLCINFRMYVPINLSICQST